MTEVIFPTMNFGNLVVLTQSLSHVQLCDTMNCSMPGSSILPVCQSMLKFISIKSVMLSNHLILCCPLLLPSIFPSIRVFSNELASHIGWPKYWSIETKTKYWSVSFIISPSIQYSRLISFRMTGLILQSKGLSRIFSSTIPKHQFFDAQHSLWSSSHMHT